MEYISHYNIKLPELHHMSYGQNNEWEGATGESKRLVGNRTQITLLACLRQYIIHIVDYMRA